MVQKALSSRRRGMVLLIVLALLAMVGLTAVTFLLTTGQLRDASEQNRQMGEITVDPDAMLQDAVMQVIRGTRDSGSPIYGNSLLEDEYGTASADNPAQFDATVSATLEDGMAVVTATGGNPAYAGRVITCIDENSPSFGRSSVILKFRDGKYYCLPFPDGKAFESSKNGGSTRFMVNDVPFQGTRDYDAVDENNYFLTKRQTSDDTDGGTVGQILPKNYSFRNAATKYGELDADNDGLNDAYWLDLAMPVFTAKDGTRFKPLFGIVVEDLDGRINVNAHGDLYCATREGKSYGLGRGPGEVNLNVLNSIFSTSTNSLIYGRFSSDYSATTSSTPDYYATNSQKGAWYAGFTDTISGDNVQRMPYDTRGILKADVTGGGEASWLQLGGGTVTSGSGMVQVGASASASLNPYDLDLGQNQLAGAYSNSSGAASKPATSKDMPYSPSELEAILRPYDFDTPFLPNRLAMRLGNGSALGATQKSRARTMITTESWDVPIIPEEVANSLRDGHSEEMLPEILAKWPVDLLRAATFNDTTDPIQGDGRFKKREAFAQCLYQILERLEANMGEGDENRSRNNAQWAVNVVDFLDADSIMTPFCYDGTNWVYGCERPELLLVETMAMHSKNTEYDVKDEDSNFYVGGKNGDRKNDKDTEIYESDKADGSNLEGELDAKVLPTAEKNLAKLNDNKVGPDGKSDFDQLLRPQGALFVEIFNPWSQNDKYPTVSSDLYASGTREVSLTKSSEGSSVWRLIVMKPGSVATDWNEQARDETEPDWNASNVERVIDFARDTTPTEGSVSNHHALGGDVNLGSQEYVLVGPTGRTILSFSDPGKTAVSEVTASDVLRTIDLDEKKIDGSGYAGKVLPIGNDRGARMSLTEDSSSGYPSSYDADTLQLTTPLDCPLDYSRSNSSLYLRNRTQTNYCIVHLQRLANPNRAHNTSTNPYVTIDSMTVDLTVFNARTTQNDSENNDTGSVNEIVTRKRGKDSSKTNLWKQEYAAAATTSSSGKNGSGAFSGKFDQNFGAGITDSAKIPWLGWINRPPVSPFELMNVTFRSSSTLLREIDFESNASDGLKTYGFLPDFSGKAANRKFFGYVRVPSPQTVTPMVLNKSNFDAAAGTADTLPFAYYSMNREPGKININTIYDKQVLAALLNLSSNGEINNIWSNFTTSRQTAFRSIAEAPENSILRSFSLFSSSETTAGDGSSETLHPFFRLKDSYRLANLTTTRSNVFAVWVTMGFFEVNDSDQPTGSELGEMTGDVKRYRSFYLIDRSIPVGFERGKNWNAENVILLKRLLQ